MKTIIPFLILLGVICNAEPRTWTAINGKEVEAEFVSNEKGIVKLKLKSGKVFEVPLNKLSKLDQDFLKADFSPKGPTSEKDSSDGSTPLINETDVEQILNEAIDGSSGFEERDGRLYNGSELLSGWVRWDDLGDPTVFTFFKDGKEDGSEMGWYKNGQKAYEGTYKDGKLNGFEVGWYKNGQKAYEGTYKDGKLLVKTVWVPEGGKCPNTKFKNGNGTVYNYWDNGQKSYKGTYKEGKQDGLQNSWYENGQKEFEGIYADGKENGLHTEWHDNGKKWMEVTYKDGEYISDKYWNSKGEEVETYEESEVEDLKMISEADVERFAKNAIEMDENVERPDYTGWWKFVHKGQLLNLAQMKNGKQDGLYMTWHDNGKIASIARFREGDLIQGQKYYLTGEKQATESLTKKVTWHKNGKKAHEETGSYYNGAGGADVIKFWNDEGEELEDEEGYKMLLKLSKADQEFLKSKSPSKEPTDGEALLKFLPLISDDDVERFAKNAIDSSDDTLNYTGWTKAVNDGQLVELVQLKDGKPDGPSMLWYTNGQIAEWSLYRKGEVVQLQNYYKTGEKKMINRWGIGFNVWHKNGEKAVTMRFRAVQGTLQPLQEMEMKFWDEKGEEMDQEEGMEMMGEIESDS
jgi:antitoxin component YwqK of YwqJK toxin-antitoxin module